MREVLDVCATYHVVQRRLVPGGARREVHVRDGDGRIEGQGQRDDDGDDEQQHHLAAREVKRSDERRGGGARQDPVPVGRVRVCEVCVLEGHTTEKSWSVLTDAVQENNPERT